MTAVFGTSPMKSAQIHLRRPLLVPQDRPLHVPVSHGQKRLWFLDQLGSASTAYNVVVALRLRGPLNRAALANAIQTIVARHESLRTHFAVVDGAPVQVIEDARQIPLPATDLRALAAGVQDARLQAALLEEHATPFDLANGPLLRVRLVQLADDTHVLVR